MMDGCTILGFKISSPIHYNYKAWKSQDIFLYNSDCARLKEEFIYILNGLRVSKSCGIFQLWVKYPFKYELFNYTQWDDVGHLPSSVWQINIFTQKSGWYNKTNRMKKI